MLKKVILSVISTFIITFLLIFALAFVYFKSDMDEKYVNIAIIAITIISILCNTIYFCEKRRGMVFGLEVSGIYICIMEIVAGVITQNFIMTKNGVLFVLLAICSGIIGGIIGTNIKASKS